MTNFESAGRKVGEIPVSISYNIIELVCNAYDAFATKVAVYIPSDKASSDAILPVYREKII